MVCDNLDWLSLCSDDSNKVGVCWGDVFWWSHVVGSEVTCGELMWWFATCDVMWPCCPVLLQYYKVLRQYHSVLQSTTPVLQSARPVLQSTTPVNTKHHRKNTNQKLDAGYPESQSDVLMSYI